MKCDKRITLEKSIEFWKGSAEFDKQQLKYSLAVVAGGIAFAGAGIGGLLCGEIPAGIAAVGGGSVLAGSFGKICLEEAQSYVETASQLAIYENQLDQIKE